MNKTNLIIKTIDDYHAICTPSIQKHLQLLRKAIVEAAPKAVETISYGMSAFKQNKVLVYYPANINHIGFYHHQNPLSFLKTNYLPF